MGRLTESIKLICSTVALLASSCIMLNSSITLADNGNSDAEECEEVCDVLVDPECLPDLPTQPDIPLQVYELLEQRVEE